MFFSLLIQSLLVFGQVSPKTSNIKLKGNYEVAFTPRFSYFKKSALTPNDKSFFDFRGAPRISLGKEIKRSNYISFAFDYRFRHSDNDSLDNNFNGFGVGIQHSHKFIESALLIKSVNIFSKKLKITAYPETMFSFGLTNVFSGYKSFTLTSSRNLFGFFEVGGGVNFLLSNWINLQLAYQIEYLPSIKSKPQRFFPLQTRIILKL